jgi:nucleoside-diphosphate-sugar epimerase
MNELQFRRLYPRIAVLEGPGFIGSHLSRRLKAFGDIAHVVDIRRCRYMHEDDYCLSFALPNFMYGLEVFITLLD